MDENSSQLGLTTGMFASAAEILSYSRVNDGTSPIGVVTCVALISAFLTALPPLYRAKPESAAHKSSALLQRRMASKGVIWVIKDAMRDTKIFFK